ncbi:hypothetical protein VB816_30710, partial [Limnoraphis robusta CCNP1324]|uniref:hypothetical protein n=1 Tax=Limnoraphis robusta TaxID=1118279 RepID=UPI002B1F3657
SATRGPVMTIAFTKSPPPDRLFDRRHSSPLAVTGTSGRNGRFRRKRVAATRREPRDSIFRYSSRD